MIKMQFPLEVGMFTLFCYFLLFSLLYLPILLHVYFALFLLVIINVVYVNSVRFKHIDTSCHFIELNYRGYNLNFLKLKQLLIDADIESNPGPTKNNCRSPVGCPKNQFTSQFTVYFPVFRLVHSLLSCVKIPFD